jgi:hypothetical protein
VGVDIGVRLHMDRTTTLKVIAATAGVLLRRMFLFSYTKLSVCCTNMHVARHQLHLLHAHSRQARVHANPLRSQLGGSSRRKGEIHSATKGSKTWSRSVELDVASGPDESVVVVKQDACLGEDKSCDRPDASRRTWRSLRGVRTHAVTRQFNGQLFSFPAASRFFRASTLSPL